VKPRPRILVNADFDVVLYHALKVLHYRSVVLDLADPTPPDIQASLKTILTIIQRTFSSTSTELHDRLQWPLFLTGIETNDAVYREWILTRITSQRVAEALIEITEAQENAGQRLSMLEVRSVLQGDTSSNLLPINAFYLVQDGTAYA
jgi:hypothetical protein